MASRGQFSSKLGFVMAAAGSAVGLGNIWGFPTQAAGNGGAAFVLMYLVMAFCLAYPALMAELVIGRYARANVVNALGAVSEKPIVHKLGMLAGGYGVLVASLILSFYAIVAGWMLSYMLGALADMGSLSAAKAWFTKGSLVRDLAFTATFMGLTVFVIAGGVEKGIERWSTRLMPMLIGLLVCLIIYVMTQPGAMEGLGVYLIPDFSKIFDAGLIIDAMGQAFFSLSLGVGTMLIYGSYLSHKESLPKLSGMVMAVDLSIAFLAGLLIIPAIFVAKHYGAEIYSESGTLIGGPDLIFQILPYLFDSMGGIGVVVAFAFFLLMSIAALTSSISMLEVPVALVVENGHMNRPKAALLLGFIILAISAAIVLNFELLFLNVIAFTTKFSQPLLGVVMCVFVGWLWHRGKLLQEIQQGHEHIENTLFWKIWPHYVKFVCPALILATFAQSL